MMRPLGVDDGDGEPVAEAIVRRAAVVGLDQEAGVEELRLAESAFDQSAALSASFEPGAKPMRNSFMVEAVSPRRSA